MTSGIEKASVGEVTRGPSLFYVDKRADNGPRKNVGADVVDQHSLVEATLNNRPLQRHRLLKA